MEQHSRPVQLPGSSVLGGAANGFSYEGVRHDALAREEANRKREAGGFRDAPSRPVGTPKPPTNPCG